MALNVTSFNLNVSISGMSSSSGNFSDTNIFDTSGGNLGAVFNLPNQVKIKRIELDVSPFFFFTSATGAINEAKTNPFFLAEIYLSANTISGFLGTNNAFVGNLVAPVNPIVLSANVLLENPYSICLLTHQAPSREIEMIASSVYLRKISAQVIKDTTVTDATIIVNLKVYWENIC